MKERDGRDVKGECYWNNDPIPGTQGEDCYDRADGEEDQVNLDEIAFTDSYANQQR